MSIRICSNFKKQYSLETQHLGSLKNEKLRIQVSYMLDNSEGKDGFILLTPSNIAKHNYPKGSWFTGHKY
ncbi:MAG TPA: hypothetical protein DER39_08925 [Porphyromonadaceae bacterium]|nr:hypothetical protein [Porphyromonadaceae bacterium]